MGASNTTCCLDQWLNELVFIKVSGNIVHSFIARAILKVYYPEVAERLIRGNLEPESEVH